MGRTKGGAAARVPKIFVMIPTYNERESIRRLLDEIDLLGIPHLHIVVVDDASPDGTGQILMQLARRRRRLHVVRRLNERGRGTAGIAGFKYALKHGAEMVVEMDADFSHHPRYIPDLIKAARGCDVVVGSRFVPGGRDLERGLLRHAITKIANFYIRRVLKIADVYDCTSGYRLFHRRVLEAIKMDNTVSLGPSIVQELLYKATLLGFTVREIPIVFVDRKEGKSTFNWRIMVQSLLMTLIIKFLFSSLRRVEIHETRRRAS
ncbi:polyprenol monophosphomannose synthase [candidate division FCPU426 bacterium]|nr:polyprenol monophosphomannose synthase [candidate division FCPU426 bacterium]